MVSPIMWFDPTQRAIPQTAEKARSPAGMTLVSPTSSGADTPSTIGQITPTRKMLFERTPHQQRSSVMSQTRPSTSRRSTSGQSIESRQEEEIQDLRSANEQKDGQLRVLHQRFHTIQQGLGSIDQERSNLVEKAKQLEKEKRNIQKQLALREREIQALVKRCASQEEKMRESSRLRAQNRELTQALESIQNQLTDTDQETKDLQYLRNMLQESELAREKLQEKLQKLQREHDCIVTTLQECLGNIRQLTEEKQQIEDERRLERRRAEIEMERQRLAHAEDIETKQSKIDQMERILQDNMYMKNSLRREKALRQEEAEQIVADYEQRISELEGQLLDQRSESTDEDYEETLSLLQQKIEEKDAFMLGLKEEFSGQMGELMKKQTCLDEAEEEKKNLEIKVKQLEKLESDHSALVEYVEILDSNLADLTNENAHLTIDKESLEEERANMQRKMKELEFQLSRQQLHRQEREGDFRDLLEAEKEELRADLEASLAEARNEAVSLQSELASRSRWIEKLETALSEGRRDIVQKEKYILQLQQEKDEISNAVQSSLSRARQEVSELEAEIQSRDDQLRSMENTLETNQCEYSKHHQHVKRLENNLRAIDYREDAPEHDDSEAERSELEERIQELGELVTNLNEMRKLLLEEAQSERSSKREIEQKKNELEVALRKAHSELRSREEQIKTLKQANMSLEHQAEEIRKTSMKSEDDSSMALSRSKHLETELATARALLEEKESTLNRLQQELDRTLGERESSVKTLEEAKSNIDLLQCELSNKVQIEKVLKTVQDALSEQKLKTQKIQEEYSAAIQAQLERETYNREATSRIMVLENQIVELKEKQSELRGELKESVKVMASKDRQMKLVELEKQEFEKRAVTLHGQLDEKHSMLVSAEQHLKKKQEVDALLKSELDVTTKVLSSHEEKIKEMDAALSENEKVRSDLELKLSESTTKINILEQEITTLSARSMSLDQQLHSALDSLSENRAVIHDAELKFEAKSLELSKMEQDFEATKQSQAETEEKLSACESRLVSLEEIVASQEAANAALEKNISKSNSELATLTTEKAALQEIVASLEADLTDANKTSIEQYQELKSHHDQACNALLEKEALIESLEESIQSGKSELEKAECQLFDCREEIEILEQEISKKARHIDGLELTIEGLSKNESEIGQAFNESETKRAILERELEESRAAVEKLSKSLEERESRLLEVEQQLEETTKQKISHAQHSNDLSEKCSQLENRVKDLNGVIDLKEATLQEFGNKLGVVYENIAEKDKQIETLHDAISSLENSLEDSKQYAKNVQEDLEVQLSEERQRHSESNSKLASVEVKAMEEAERYQDIIFEQEDKIKSLETQIQETIESQDKVYAAKEVELSSEIKQLQTTIALKDDEIQELRVIELNDREETIATLSESLQKLKAQMEDNEVEMTRASNDLKRENKSLKTQIEDQERKALLLCEEHEEELAKKDQKIHDLETLKLKVEMQLAERHTVISELSERELDLQKQERVLLASCDQLIKSETSAKEELDRMKNALDVSIMKAKEDLEVQRQQFESKLRKESDEVTSKLRTMEKKFHETDRVMRERTTLLGEMVEHNKDLESKLDKQQAQVCALEEETSRCRQELSETQTELKYAREELCKRENELTAKLAEERLNRENAERSLAKLKVKYTDAANAKKMVAELEKDNSALKDKISRQEAFLQRKLQKEKIQRARPSGGERTPVRKGGAGSSSSNSSVDLQTPPRASRPPHSFLKTPSSTSKIPSYDDNNNSQRSNRSAATTVTASSFQRLKSRSVIPSIRTTTSSETI